MKTLRPYQEEALKILARDTSGLVGSEMGTGKTLVGVERVRSVQYKGTAPRVLVVAPVNTHSQWKALFEEQYPSLNGTGFLRIIGTHKSDEDAWNSYLTKKKPGIYIISWEAMRGATGEDLRRSSNSKGTNKLTIKAIETGMKNGSIPPWTRTGTWDLVIADEVHRISRRDSANKLVLTRIKTEHKLALSATPGGNKPEGLWSVLNWLWKDRYGSFWTWAKRFLEVKEEIIGEFGPNPQVKRTPGGEKEPGAAWVDMPCKVKHRLEDVGGYLPEVIERVITVPMDDVQRRMYNEFVEQQLAWISGVPTAASLPVEQRIRLRQLALGTVQARFKDDGELDLSYNEHAPQLKVRALKEIISDLPDDEPVLVFAHSSKWAKMAAAMLQEDPRIAGEARAWTGELTPKQREALKGAFGKGIRIVVAQIQAMAEGTDGIQHVCRCEVWASPTEDALMNKQARGRLHRPGQTRPVQRWVLRSEDSIDTEVWEGLAQKEEVMDRLYRNKSAAA